MTALPSKPADAHPDVLPSIRDRWSPVRFDATRTIPDDQLRVLLDAARWAPSSFNEQPWRYLCARRSDPHRAALEAALFGGNAWARRASVLLCSLMKQHYSRNDKPNAMAAHDVGLATMSLVIQAGAMGMVSHQMRGFDREAVRVAFAVPDAFTPVAMVAVGWYDPELAEAELAQKEERKARIRRPLSETVFGARFGEPFALAGEG